VTGFKNRKIFLAEVPVVAITRMQGEYQERSAQLPFSRYNRRRLY